MSNSIESELNGDIIIIDENNGLLFSKESGDIVSNNKALAMIAVNGQLVIKIRGYKANCELSFEGWE